MTTTDTHLAGYASQRRVMIEAVGVRKTYEASKGRSVEALTDINLSIRDGEFLSIVGPSGCGKSTFLSLVAGLLPISGGSIKVAGKTVTEPSTDVGIVFQGALLLDWRTVLENVMVPVEVMGLPRKEYEKRARDLLDMTGLAAFANHYPWQLSGGMQRRVAICRALVYNPPILLLDEPFGALDEMTRNRLNEELLMLRERSLFTALFVTHSVSEAVFLSNRIIVMAAHPGRWHAEIKVDFPYPRRPALREQPEFQAKVTEVSRLLHEVEVHA